MPQKELLVEREGMGFRMNRSGKNERLKIAQLQEYSKSRSRDILENLSEDGCLISFDNVDPTIQRLMETFFLFYAVADRRPDGSLKKVTTDIPIEEEALPWLEELFRRYKKPFPKLNAPIVNMPKVSRYKTTSQPLSTFSGGKDSTFVVLENDATPVHVAKINKSTQTRELDAVMRLRDSFSRQVNIVPLLNSVTGGHGSLKYEVRDGLIYALLLHTAHQKGADTILSGSYGESEWYCASPEAIALFNDILEKKGIQTKVQQLEGWDEEELIRLFIKKYPDIFEMTAPCVTSDDRYARNRKWFMQKFPDFPLFEGVCGMCGKDIQLNLARLLHDPKVLALERETRRAVAQYYLQKIHGHRNTDILDFIEPALVDKICAEYEL